MRDIMKMKRNPWKDATKFKPINTRQVLCYTIMETFVLGCWDGTQWIMQDRSTLEPHDILLYSGIPELPKGYKR